MHLVLKIIKFIVHKLSLFMVVNLLFIGLPLYAFTYHATNENTVKSWLSEGDTYQKLIDSTFDLIQQEGEDGSLSDSLEENEFIDPDKLITTIQQEVDGPFVQEKAETVIDAFYSWLRGDVAAPDFQVSLNEKAPAIKKAMQAELEKQLDELPACTTEQILNNPDFDPFKAKCMPPGLDLSRELENTAENFIEENPLFQEYTGQDLNLDGDTLNTGPLVYDYVRAIPIALIVGVLAFSLIVFVTSKSWFAGLREIGASLISTGVFMIIAFLLSSRIANTVSSQIVKEENTASANEFQAAKEIVEPVVANAVADIARTGLIISIVLLILGIVMWVVAYKYRDKIDDHEDVPDMLKDEQSNSEYLDKLNKDSKKPKSPKNQDEDPELLLAKERNAAAELSGEDATDAKTPRPIPPKEKDTMDAEKKKKLASSKAKPNRSKKAKKIQ